MTSLVNVMASQLIQTNPHYELVYLTVSLLVATLSAIVASFLGLRWRRQPIYDPTTSTSIHNVDGGPTVCGKTRFVFKLIENAHLMIHFSPRKIVYCYSEYQQLFATYPQVEFQHCLPQMSDFDGREPLLLVIDDLMNKVGDSVVNLFTNGSHHRNVSVVLMVQNVFYKNKHVRTISLNAHYMVLFKNPRDASQFSSLARQIDVSQ